MRTEPDGFWMDAITGVVDRATGEGLASVSVTSPCFLPGSGMTGTASSSKKSQSKMNMHEAADRADAILNGTFAAIKPPVQ
ncbi:hypothetical protein OOK58_43195 [Streptomyces sp. NBC_01728]|nr:hypothetical protein [Streptomyces sp. NBC_01719]MCX4458720.1 hypothetical protein [Streptomyces sp. NBC_01719]MCX4498077.1 hypothetical protein [Streptomyces sp. NBC_01728]